MKIGILTFHGADNYGAVLQAYALKETVKTLGNDVEIINYIQPYIIKNYKLFKINRSSLKLLIKSLLSNIVYLFINISQKRKFSEFRTKYMDVSQEKFNTVSSIKGKEVYIVGSDQVWNEQITNNDDAFFLTFCKNNEKKIAYAVSVGNDIISDSNKVFIKNNMSNFDYVSVRESELKNILESFTEKTIYHVLDPTLLADRRIWDKFIKSNKFKYKYLLLYMLTGNEEVMKVANLVSKKLNLKVISISNSIKKNPYGFKNIRRVGPIDFISLISNASFIVTDSFHGTAFSIIFNRDFITIPHETRGNRMISLLNLLNLNSRIVKNVDSIKDDFNYHIDYEMPNELLNKYKIASLNFLKQAIYG